MEMTISFNFIPFSDHIGAILSLFQISVNNERGITCMPCCNATRPQAARP